jgi:hypothetical protein
MASAASSSAAAVVAGVPDAESIVVVVVFVVVAGWNALSAWTERVEAAEQAVPGLGWESEGMPQRRIVGGIALTAGDLGTETEPARAPGLVQTALGLVVAG